MNQRIPQEYIFQVTSMTELVHNILNSLFIFLFPYEYNFSKNELCLFATSIELFSVIKPQ